MNNEPKCNPHPKAPHGFDRNASHSAHRYVCDCESWEPYQAGYDAGFKAGMESEQSLCALAENTQELEQPVQEPVDKVSIMQSIVDSNTGFERNTAPQARTSTDVQQQPLCPCKDRPADQCDEEWGPDCDLGNNEAHCRPAQQPDTSCKFPLCQTEQYQQMLAKQVARDLFGSEQPQLLTDEEIAQAWAGGEHNASAVTKRRVSRAIQQAVLKKNGVMK